MAKGLHFSTTKLYQLTWQSKKGFIYDLNTFEPLTSFAYGESTEGWGLTHNKQELIKSDGTERIWFLDPQNGQEKRFYRGLYEQKKSRKTE